MNRSIRTLVLGLTILAASPAVAQAGSTPGAPAMYAVDLVSPAATGVAMNTQGAVVGTSYLDTGCGSSCLPPLQTVVWRGGARIVLPGLPGRPTIQASGMNASGWVIGTASPSTPGFDDRAVVWKPVGQGYQAIDLGILPDTVVSVGIGIDDANRAVGYASSQFFPPTVKSFMWTEAGGLVDLTAQGFPETPVAISPGGTVATTGFWYHLGDPSSAVALAAPPRSFRVQGYPTAINDAGDQARFLVSVNGENLVYLYRYHHEGTWQSISATGTGHLTRYGVGSINPSGDITATVASTGVIAHGPDGAAENLAPLLSPAYGGSDVTVGGPMDATGRILSEVIIGQSQRLVRLVPAVACGAACLRVTDLSMRGKFIDDPNDPGHCTPIASDHVLARATITDEAGDPVAGVKVTGHFLDDYWLDQKVTGRTGPLGSVRFVHDGPACVGAEAFVVTDAARAGMTFDRSTGTLTNSVIPQL